MIVETNLNCGLVSVLLCTVVLSGCAVGGVLVPKSTGRPPASVSPAPADRQELVEAFEHKRLAAEFDAAIARSRQGDDEACEILLLRVLERNPNHHDARLLLADLMVATDRIAEAEGQLRQITDCDPSHAVAHYQLALLLEMQGRHNQAMPLMERAVQLAPHDPLYCESLHVIAESLEVSRTY